MTAHRNSRSRRGSALLFVLVAMVVLAVLSSAGLMSTYQEARAARGAQVRQRAMAVAEFGLNQQLDTWTQARRTMAVGGIDSSNVVVANGDTARVRVQRLDGQTFQIVSIGRANIGNGVLEAQRQASLLVRLSQPRIVPGSAIVSHGNIEVKGSIDITGRNTTPPGWTGCDAFGVRDTFAISYNPAKTATVQKPATQAVGGTYADPNAASVSTFTVFGTETFESLAAKANVTTAGGSPSPTGTATACSPSSTNWGEPDRGGAAIVGCQGYFPVIYSAGDLHLNGGRGQGILLVNGSLRINGNFKFVGLIVVMDDFRPNGNADIYGSVLVRNRTTDNSLGNGNTLIAYSRCAVGQALGALAVPRRVHQRAWVQLH
ncbi:MAG: hypothetical protein IBJ03_07300 [Gemmatimonadaceae bacterium]|nr:hypothetical protein [Gemmatimonadaceae bacterium]